MSTGRTLLKVLSVIASAILLGSPVYGQSTPLADHHQHLFSPAITMLLSRPDPSLINTVTARDLVSLLDAAGMRRAVVLSVACMFGSPNRTVENEYDKVKAENDWTSEQVGLSQTGSSVFTVLIRSENMHLRSSPAAVRIGGSAPTYGVSL